LASHPGAVGREEGTDAEGEGSGDVQDVVAGAVADRSVEHAVGEDQQSADQDGGLLVLAYGVLYRAVGWLVAVAEG
jgi:hypothetical protein